MIHLILTLALIGAVVYFITKIPMNENFKTLIYIIVVICVIYYLMNVFGIGDLPVPHFR